MSSIDPEVLYLILTKTSAKESFYGFSAATGTIQPRQAAEVYERITGNRVGANLKWSTPIDQLNALLAKCNLPPLGAVLLAEGAPSDAALLDTLARVHATKWPTFSALSSLFKSATAKKVTTRH